MYSLRVWVRRTADARASSSRLLLGARPLRGDRRSVRRGDAGIKRRTALSGRSLVAPAFHESVLGARLGHRRDRRCPEPHLGRPSRRRLAREQREGDDAHSPIGQPLLSGGAIGPRIRPEGRAGLELGRTRSGLRVAAVARQPRRGREGQRLDHGGGTRSRHPTTPARGRGDAVVGEAPAPGSRARPRRATPPGPPRRTRPQVLARRQVPAADRRAGQDGRPRQPDDAESSVCGRVRRRGQRSVRRRHRQPPHRRLRCRQRHLQAALVCVRREDGRRGAARVCAERSAGEVVPRRHVHRHLARRAGVRLRSQQQPHSGLPQGRHVRARKASCRRTRSARP